MDDQQSVESFFALSDESVYPIEEEDPNTELMSSQESFDVIQWNIEINENPNEANVDASPYSETFDYSWFSQISEDIQNVRQHRNNQNIETSNETFRDITANLHEENENIIVDSSEQILMQNAQLDLSLSYTDRFNYLWYLTLDYGIYYLHRFGDICKC